MYLEKKLKENYTFIFISSFWSTFLLCSNKYVHVCMSGRIKLLSQKTLLIIFTESVELCRNTPTEEDKKDLEAETKH